MGASDHRVTRRRFLTGAAAGGAALMSGALTSVATAAPTATSTGGPWIEATIPQLQSLMQTRQLTSRELTRVYLRRIEEIVRFSIP